METKYDPKKNILPHSQAKLNYYDTYLRRYLRILSLSPYITKINIIDLFCGTGIYEDGKEGSPIIACKAIMKVLEENLRSRIKTEFTLIVNDGVKDNVEKVKNHLTELNSPEVFKILFNSYDSDLMFKKVNSFIRQFGKEARNLVFIDPYGYKEIHKKDLQSLLENRYTEIILFLPISHMHRFKKIAIRDYDSPVYKKLRDFIYEFFPESSPLRKNDTINIQDFISYLNKAFNFNNKYFSTSYFIQRDKANFNSLFFITSNIYGMEKILEIKWELDKITGKGYSLGQSSLNEQELLSGFKHEEFERDLLDYMNNKPDPSNIDLYSFTISKERLPKQTNEILKRLQQENEILVIDSTTKKDARKNSFYVNYDNWKTGKPRVTFKII